jgi:hypothetical protein
VILFVHLLFTALLKPPIYIDYLFIKNDAPVIISFKEILKEIKKGPDENPPLVIIQYPMKNRV